MNKERNCQKCIHHISGLCSKWECEIQTLEDYRNKVIDEFVEKLIIDVDSFQAEINGYKADVLTIDYFMEFVDEIADQLKAGVENGKNSL